MTPLVDVVVAVHDVRRDIGRAAASVLAATAPVRLTVVAHHLGAPEVARALGASAEDSRLRVVELHDGERSPAGPFNHGLRLADARYVAIMGSDDFFDGGALDAWTAYAEAHGTDYLVAPLRYQGGGRLHDPLTRPRRTGPLDLVRDRLAYRTAPLGLVRRSYLDALGTALTPGLRTGEDIELGLALLAGGGRVDYDPALPPYVVGADAPERVTLESRPVVDELGPVERLLGTATVSSLDRRARLAVAVKLVRFHVVPAVARRPDAGEWSEDDLACLDRVVGTLVQLAPEVVGAVSRADARLLEAARSRRADLVAAAAVRWTGGSSVDRALTPSLWRTVDVDGPVRRALVLGAATRREARAGASGDAPGPQQAGEGGTVGTAVRSALARRGLPPRTQLPRSINAAIDYVADHPRSLPGRVAALRFGRVRPDSVPPPTTLPDTPVRVYIGPVNYSEQGYAWARALEAARPDVGARNMSVEVPRGFAFRSDTEVPEAVYHRSRAWQVAELAAVRRFTHALVEAERPLFGRLFWRDVVVEARELAGAGISTAYLAHGTDVRLPSRHVGRTRWSPYRDADMYVPRYEAEARRNIELLERLGRPLFVSTPDLLADVPGALWVPVVVDPERWTVARGAARSVPVVAHVPSNAGIKGTQQIRPALQRLHERGVIEYREITGVPSATMPAVWADADIVLDQFRLGSYGVAACEAMAAGCVVVGHVLDDVRATVRSTTGRDLPLVEADPDTVEGVVEELATNVPHRTAVARASRDFVAAVHDGALSAGVLLDAWIDPTGT